MVAQAETGLEYPQMESARAVGKDSGAVDTVFGRVERDFAVAGKELEAFEMDFATAGKEPGAVDMDFAAADTEPGVVETV